QGVTDVPDDGGRKPAGATIANNEKPRPNLGRGGRGAAKLPGGPPSAAVLGAVDPAKVGDVDPARQVGMVPFDLGKRCPSAEFGKCGNLSLCPGHVPGVTRNAAEKRWGIGHNVSYLDRPTFIYPTHATSVPIIP